MNQETIENHIKNLGKVDFDGVATLVLIKMFKLKAVDVDGKGDGGSDYRTFHDLGGKLTLAIQKTVQENGWKEKAIEDASSAVAKHNAQRFFFLTSRAHEPTALRSVENDIASTLGISATCLGATELAGIIMTEKLLGDFAHVINLPMHVPLEHRPDRHEIMLHSYCSFSDDRHVLRTGIYNTTLQAILHFSNKSLSRDELVEKAMQELGTPESRRDELNRQVDSLMGNGEIIYNKSTGLFSLHPDVCEKFQVSDGIYVKELGQLAAAQTDLITSFGGKWSQQQSAAAAMFLSQRFVQQQLQNAKHSSLPLSMTGVGCYEQDPESALRTLILEAGVPRRDINNVLLNFIDMASDKPLVKKLTRAVVHVALESADINKTVAILGVNKWADIRVILDASVAIPYLSTSLFAPTQGRFSRGSNECIEVLRKLDARLTIPWIYLNECASHLVSAVRYCRDMKELEDSFAYSQNGFVSHYYQLKQSGKSVPDSLAEFISRISNAAFSQSHEMSTTIRSVMSDLQPLFESYGVKYEDMKKPAEHYRKDIEVAYTYALKYLNRKKSEKLIDHDVQVLCHIKKCVSENSDRLMCLTWDGTMIKVGSEKKNCGWIVSPQEANDIIQPGLKLSQGRMISLTHTIARTMAKPAELGARIVDRIVDLSNARLDDWEYRKRIQEFRDQAINRIDTSSPTYLDSVELEAFNFLKSEGIAVPEENVNDNEITIE